MPIETHTFKNYFYTIKLFTFRETFPTRPNVSPDNLKPHGRMSIKLHNYKPHVSGKDWSVKVVRDDGILVEIAAIILLQRQD